MHNICPINNPLTRAEKDQLRAEARDIWQDETGRRAIWDDMEIHHRIPLEYSHLFPNAEPNRLANLVGVGFDDHTAISAVWTGLRGTNPSAADVMRTAIGIDQTFGGVMKFAR